MVFLVSMVAIAILLYILNKFNFLAKLLLQAIIIAGIILMCMHKSNSIIDGMICVGVSWALIAISYSKSLWDTILHLFWFIIGAWLVSFIVGIIDMSNGAFSEMIRAVSLLGLGISAVCSFHSEGQFLSFSSDPNSIYDSWATSDSSDNQENITIEKSIFGNDNIYRDKNGNVIAKGEKNIFGEEIIRDKNGNKVAKTEHTIWGETRYINKDYQTIGKVEKGLLGDTYIKDKDGNISHKVENSILGDKKKIKKY